MLAAALLRGLKAGAQGRQFAAAAAGKRSLGAAACRHSDSRQPRSAHGCNRTQACRRATRGSWPAAACTQTRARPHACRPCTSSPWTWPTTAGWRRPMLLRRPSTRCPPPTLPENSWLQAADVEADTVPTPWSGSPGGAPACSWSRKTPEPRRSRRSGRHVRPLVRLPALWPRPSSACAAPSSSLGSRRFRHSAGAAADGSRPVHQAAMQPAAGWLAWRE